MFVSCWANEDEVRVEVGDFDAARNIVDRLVALMIDFTFSIL